LRRDLGARHDPGHDAGLGHRRLGLAPSPQVAARGSGARRRARRAESAAASPARGVARAPMSPPRGFARGVLLPRARLQFHPHERGEPRMTGSGVVPIEEIGNVQPPPFVRPPDLMTIFARRAERLDKLAPGHVLEGWLRFLADISRAQEAALPELPPG